MIREGKMATVCYVVIGVVGLLFALLMVSGFFKIPEDTQTS